jgi:hypothetical protein
VHRPDVWGEITKVIADVQAKPRKLGLREGETMRGSQNAGALEMAFKTVLVQRGWLEEPPPSGSGAELQLSGCVPLHSYDQPDFVKDRIGIQVHFGSDLAVAYGVFEKHLASFVGDKIDVGIDVLPMKEMQAEMSSGVAYYEGEVYNVLRHGRNNPAVPLLVIGVVP